MAVRTDNFIDFLPVDVHRVAPAIFIDVHIIARTGSLSSWMGSQFSNYLAMGAAPD
jgi:hypothetical protein